MGPVSGGPPPGLQTRALAESLMGEGPGAPRVPSARAGRPAPSRSPCLLTPPCWGAGCQHMNSGAQTFGLCTLPLGPQFKASTSAEYTRSAPGAPKSEFPQHPAESVGSELPPRTPGSRFCPVLFPRLWGTHSHSARPRWGPVMGAAAVSVHTARRGRCVPLTPGCLPQERKQLLQTRTAQTGLPGARVVCTSPHCARLRTKRCLEVCFFVLLLEAGSP